MKLKTMILTTVAAGVLACMSAAYLCAQPNLPQPIAPGECVCDRYNVYWVCLPWPLSFVCAPLPGECAEWTCNK